MHFHKKVCYLKGGGTFVRAVNLNVYRNTHDNRSRLLNWANTLIKKKKHDTIKHKYNDNSLAYTNSNKTKT